ncbi:uncharacterized protein ACWYII_018114 [Salvelinus alpinus]
MASSLPCLSTLAWMRARFLAVWRSTLPSKVFGMEMQYGSRANISHQPPGGRDFVDLRLYPLFPPSSSKSHQHQLPQSATGPCLGTHTHQSMQQFPPSDNQVVNRISACLADISVWMTDHHLKLNLGKTELLFLPGKDCPFHDLAITVDNSIVSSSQSAKNLGVILDNTLSFSTNIKAVTRSCRFMLYNIRRVRPCLTQEAAQVLIQALVISRLDYCNSLLAGLPACAIKPLQLIQNAAARLVFNFPKFSHVTPLLRSLHWLPVEARIRYKTMVLAYGAVRGTAPPYLQALIRPYTQTRALRSSTSGLLASLPLRKYSSRSAQSKLFAALAPQWWNKLPHDARSAESITTFRRHLKPHLFKEYLG